MPERDFWLALSRVPGLGPKRVAGLIDLFGSARAAWHASPGDLSGSGLPPVVRRHLLEAQGRLDPGAQVKELAELGLSAVTPLDSEYPSALRSVPGCPAALFVRGRVSALSSRAAAVVGTRRPTHAGLEVTAAIAGDLATHGVVIVSGLALGIDAEAHRACVARAGVTVAVLGSGHRRLYPRANLGLAEAIVNGGGAIISQFDPDTAPCRSNFVIRNRVVAGLSRGVVVTEAPRGSGALETARVARRLGRVVMAVPGSPLNPAAEGCLEILRQGGRAVASAADVLADLEPGVSGRVRAGGRRSERPGDDRRAAGAGGENAAVLECLGAGEIVPFAMLMVRTGLPAERLGAVLGLLEVKGFVRRRPGRSYESVKPVGGAGGQAKS